ncbi:MAG: Holliday junction resolvase RuvX [Dehalococcoidia bacterium]
MRLAGLDLGERRTGVAVSDELGLFAHPRPAIVAASDEALVAAVVGLAVRESLTALVVGVPLGLSGADTAQTARARALGAKIRAATGLRVIPWDERLSTAQAARAAPGRKARASGALDSAAAAVILQTVLDAVRQGVITLDA